MIQKLLATLFILSISCTLLAQGEFGFAAQLAGANSILGRSVAVDDDGNVYSTGYFQDDMDADPGPGQHIISSLGSWDIFVVKLDSNGAFQWAHSFGASAADQGHDVHLDPDGNPVFVGHFENSVDFDPGAGNHDMDSPGFKSAYVLKLNPDGELIWAVPFNSGADAECRSMDIDDLGNIHVAGFYSNWIDVDPGPGSVQLNSEGGVDMFIARLNSIGEYVWGKSVGGNDNDFANDIHVTSTGSECFYTGRFGLSVDFDPGAGLNTLTAVGDDDAFVSAFNFQGAHLWTYQVSGSEQIDGHTVQTDGTGFVVFAGSYQGTADFGGAQFTAMDNSDTFVCRLTPFGGFHQAVSYQADFMEDMIVEPSGAVNMIGYFSGTHDFDPGAGIHEMTSLDNNDVFVLELRADLSFNWAVQMGGDNVDYGIGLHLKDDDLYSIGYFREDIDLGGALLESEGVNDTYILKNLPDSTCGVDISIDQIGPTLTANAHNAQFIWFDCNTGLPIPDGNTAIFEANSNGSYAVIVNGACVDTSACVNVVSVGLEENQKAPFHLYPNPTTGRFSLSGNVQSIQQVLLLDMLGKEITGLRELGNNKFELAADLANGPYLIQVKYNDGIWTLPLLRTGR